MRKVEKNIINKCRQLRINGYSIGDISSTVNLSKSTVRDYVNDICLTHKQRELMKKRICEKRRNMINPRKGKCLAGREIVMPRIWSVDLVHILSHYLFDGRVDDDGCIYYNRSRYQISHMRKLLNKIFKITPRVTLRDENVYGLVFYHVEFADYIKRKQSELFCYLNNGADNLEKKVFLKAFFDDEGNVFYKKDKRRIRGYQNSQVTLEMVKNLLPLFGIAGKISRDFKNIEISGKKNLIKFSQEINFSPKIYINPQRKNSIWGRRISKTEILHKLLKAYRK